MQHRKSKKNTYLSGEPELDFKFPVRGRILGPHRRIFVELTVQVLEFLVVFVVVFLVTADAAAVLAI